MTAIGFELARVFVTVRPDKRAVAAFEMSPHRAIVHHTALVVQMSALLFFGARSQKRVDALDTALRGRGGRA